MNMGTEALKKDLREKIISCQYHKRIQGIGNLLDAYDSQLAENGTREELAEAAFFRGEASFWMGRYTDTVEFLTKSIGMKKNREYEYLDIQAYNVLGMVFSFVGYETVALTNYLQAAKTAEKNQDIEDEVVVLLNAGLLYAGLGDYRKALEYVQKAYQIAGGDYAKPNIELLVLCMVQKAQFLCRMERYEEALRVQKEIASYSYLVSEDDFWLPRAILDTYLAEHAGETERADKRIAQIREFFRQDNSYLEQIDAYTDFCGYLIPKNRKEAARDFLNQLHEKLQPTEFIQLQMRLEGLEVQYQKKYAAEQEYLESCGRFVKEQQEYERTLKLFRKQNLAHIESLQEIEEERQEFEIKSRCDLATGLLNKQTFEYEVEHYLEARNRNVTDVFVLIDIDDFKLVNDRYGHLVGDEVIVRLAGIMKERFHENCFCGRFGGDEFVILMKEISDMEEVEQRVEQLREDFSGIGFGKKQNAYCTVSVGVSYNRGIDASFKTMFSCADEAMLKAKEYGKNRVAFYEIKRGLLRYVE